MRPFVLSVDQFLAQPMFRPDTKLPEIRFRVLISHHLGGGPHDDRHPPYLLNFFCRSSPRQLPARLVVFHQYDLVCHGTPQNGMPSFGSGSLLPTTLKLGFSRCSSFGVSRIEKYFSPVFDVFSQALSQNILPSTFISPL